MNKTPIISIVIPMRNEEGYITKCVGSLLNQNCPKDSYEVIIVDGMSDDNSKQVVQELAQNHSNIFLLENPNLLTSFALNIGIRKSRGKFIGILGAHSFVETDFIEKNIETLENVDTDCAGGPIQTEGKTFVAEAISLAMSSPFGIGDALFRYSSRQGYVDTLAFGAYKREVFQKIGLFDEELVRDQDDEFNYRLRKAGGKLFITPRIRSSYYSRATIKKLWNQYFQYGFWKVRVMQKHLKVMRLRQFIPTVFVLSIIISLLLSFYSKVFLALFLVTAGSYLSCNILFALKIAAKHQWKCFFMLPLVFNVLHWSYGLGFLAGLLRFFHKWFARQSNSNVPTLEDRQLQGAEPQK